MARRISASKNTHYLETIPLQFDNYTIEELMELNDEEKQERFMSKYLKFVHPFSEYKTYFATKNMQPPVFLKFVKNFYKTYVLEKEWSEEKYIMVIDHICVKDYTLSHKAMEQFGEKYHKGELDIQLTETKVDNRKRKKRI